jgi:hypothetical protein
LALLHLREVLTRSTAALPETVVSETLLELPLGTGLETLANIRMNTTPILLDQDRADILPLQFIRSITIGEGNLTMMIMMDEVGRGIPSAIVLLIDMTTEKWIPSATVPLIAMMTEKRIPSAAVPLIGMKTEKWTASALVLLIGMRTVKLSPEGSVFELGKPSLHVTKAWTGNQSGLLMKQAERELTSMVVDSILRRIHVPQAHVCLNHRSLESVIPRGTMNAHGRRTAITATVTLMTAVSPQLPLQWPGLRWPSELLKC